MSRSSFVSAGSNSTLFSGTGTLYGVLIAPVAGTRLVMVDSANLGATPDLNSLSLTGIIGSWGPWPASPVPVYLSLSGLRVTDGLTVAATSNAALTVFHSD